MFMRMTNAIHCLKKKKEKRLRPKTQAVTLVVCGFFGYLEVEAGCTCICYDFAFSLRLTEGFFYIVALLVGFSFFQFSFFLSK